MRILWLKTEFLHPVDKGGRIRTYQMLRALLPRFDITYVTLDDGTAAPDATRAATEYCHRVVRIPFAPPRKRTAGYAADLLRNLGSELPYAIARYHVPAMQQTLTDLARPDRADLLVCDFLAPSVNVPAALPIPTVLFQHNVEATIWQRRWEAAANPLLRAYTKQQWLRMKAFEGREVRRYTQVVTVSEDDAATLKAEYGIDHLSVVPTGVDLDYFQPTGRTARRPLELLFVGSMDWMPNQDGVNWFVDRVLPHIRREVPDVTLTVVGRDPPERFRRMLSRHDGVVVTGRVDDVRPYLERAAICVVPLRIGGGTRLKIFEAMAMECPVVSTTIGAEGLPLHDGEEIVLADEPEQFAAAVVRLLRAPQLRRRIAENGAARVRRDFGWSAAAEQFAAACERARATWARTQSSLFTPATR